MESDEIRLVLSKRQLKGGLALMFLLGLGYALKSVETMRLSTYYPAPAGVYKKIITTAQTILARDGGMVGIGTSTPATKLHVVGASTVPGSPLLLAEQTGAANGTVYGGAFRATGNGLENVGGLFEAANASLSNAAIWVPLDRGGVSIGWNSRQSGGSAPPNNGLIVSGRVGIGTNVPQAPLHVYKPQQAITSIIVDNNGADNINGVGVGGQALQFAYGPIGVIGGIYHYPNGVQWNLGLRAWAGSTERERERLSIRGENGNVGIGTTNPTVKLDVAGNIRANDVCTTGGKCLSAVGGGGGGGGFSGTFYNNSKRCSGGCSASCNAGDTLISGGIMAQEAGQSYPSGNSWICSGTGLYNLGKQIICYVRCAKAGS